MLRQGERQLVIYNAKSLASRSTKDYTIFTIHNVEPLMCRNNRFFWGPENLKENSCFNMQVVASSRLNRAIFKVLIPDRGIKLGDPVIANTVNV